MSLLKVLVSKCLSVSIKYTSEEESFFSQNSFQESQITSVSQILSGAFCLHERRSMATENSKRIFFIFSISNQSQHTAADFYLSPYIILPYNLLIPKPKKVVTTLSKMVTGMRPIIEEVSKSIYSPLKAKINMLKFHSIWNKQFAK